MDTATSSNQKPASFQADLGNLPQALNHLKDKPNWVCWKWEWQVNNKGEGRWTKPLYQAKNPRQLARSNDPTTWATYDQALAAFEAGHCDGIGFNLLGTNIAAFDLDGCRNPSTGEIDPNAQRYVDRFASYTEASVSGTGLRVIGLGNGAYFQRNQAVPDSPVRIESYSNCARYIVITGNPLRGAWPHLADISQKISDLVKELDGPTREETIIDFDKASAEKKLPQELLDLICNPPSGDLSAEFHHAVCWLGDLGYSPDRIARIIHGQKIVPDRYSDRLLKEIDRCLGKAKPGQHHQAEPRAGMSVDDFYAFMPMHSYIFTLTGEMWPSTSINARIPPITVGDEKVPANQWLDRNKPVEQMTWAPGLPMIISGKIMADGGWIEREGVSCFNLYRPPTIKLGNAGEAAPWVDHVHKVYPDDANHLIKWFAHRVQKPHEKINHAIVLGGEPGIGKDTMLEPLKQAVGPWNFKEASPGQVMGRFNGFVKCTVLRISETRDHGDHDRYRFYDHTKTMMAAPPDVFRVDEKHVKEYSALNVVGVILTTNHKSDGIYLPAEDRRHFVAWSELTKADFEPDYWNKLYGWYASGGSGHVAAYLQALDISTFDAKAPPLKTRAFWAIADANRAPEDAELADVLDMIENPDAITLDRLKASAHTSLLDWLEDRRNRRTIPHRLEACGYVPIRNDTAESGLWSIKGKRQVVYAKKTLPIRDQIIAAQKLTSQ